MDVQRVVSVAPEALRPSACTGGSPLPVEAQRREAWDAARTDAASTPLRPRPYGLRLVRAADSCVALRSRSILALRDVLDDPLQIAFAKDET